MFIPFPSPPPHLIINQVKTHLIPNLLSVHQKESPFIFPESQVVIN